MSSLPYRVIEINSDRAGALKASETQSLCTLLILKITAKSLATFNVDT